MTMKSLQKKYILFFLLSALIWCIVPMLRHSLPLDTQEAIIWGKYCLWGTTKHPPLSGWIAWGFYNLIGKTDFLFYMLSPLCVLIGLLGIHKLAKCFLPPLSALMATAFQLGIIFYTYAAVEFNVNVISLALWPWTTYFFWRAYQKNKLKNWLLLALFMALNIMNKYVGSVLGIALFIFVLASPKGRTLFKNPKTYLSAGLCLLLLLPHLIWLYDNNFEMLNYISTRNSTGKIKSVVRHIIYPVKFLLAQVLFALPSIVTFILFAQKSNKTSLPKDKDKTLFLLCLGIVPTAFWMISSFISGNILKDMWNFPSLFAWGILAFYFFPHTWTSSTCQKYGKIMLSWSLIFALAYATQCLISPSERFHSDCKQIVLDLQRKWETSMPNKALEYVGGNIWFSNMMALYGSAKPMIWMKTESNPWFSANDFHQKGALVMAESTSEYQKLQKQYPEITEPNIIEMTYTSPIGKQRKRKLIWGIYPGGTK